MIFKRQFLRSALCSTFLIVLFFFTQAALATTPIMALPHITCEEMLEIKSSLFFKSFRPNSNTNYLINDNETIDNFIKTIDPQKVYLLQPDIDQFKHNMLSAYNKKTCEVLDSFYFVYKQRAEEVKKLVSEYLLSGNFTFDRNATYTYDEYRNHPQSIAESHRNLISLMQISVARSYANSNTLDEAIREIDVSFRHSVEEIQSYDFSLDAKAVLECINLSESLYLHCKPYRWHSLFLNAYAKSLNPHTSYFDFESAGEFLRQIELSVTGIGVGITYKSGYLIVDHVHSGGPADKAGLQAGDIILAIGQEKNQLRDIYEKHIDNSIQLIRGIRGTPVYMELLRKGNQGQEHRIKVKVIRDIVKFNRPGQLGTSLFIIDKFSNEKQYKIGIIKISHFYQSSYKEVKDFIEKAKKEEVDSLVLDLSNNPGGSLQDAVDIAGLFFAKGNMVASVEIQSKQILKDSSRKLNYKGPLVVLVNENSASASEVVAGALQDYKRAVVAGNMTFGKGSIQSIHPPRSRFGGLEKITTGIYFTPSGKSPEQVGITPDIHLPRAIVSDNGSEKTFLNKITVNSFKSPESTIDPYDKWESIDEQTISYLQDLSQQRINSSEKFQKIIETYEELKKQNNKMQVTVSEILGAKDFNESAAGKAVEDEAPLSDSEVVKKYLDNPFLQEGAQIAADLADKQTN